MGGELRRLTKFIPQVQAGCDFNFAWADNKSNTFHDYYTQIWLAVSP